MSAIFGLIHLDGKPVERTDLERMSNSMRFWGPDGKLLWLEGAAGFGHLLRSNTPQAKFESLPYQDSSDGLVIVSTGRLDNRIELFNTLRHLKSQVTTPDSALILSAYRKWGLDCVHHLIGDWSFAIWEPLQKRLLLARDQTGNTGLYYYHDEKFFAFASAQKGLLALPGVPKDPDELRIAQTLVSWPGDGIRTCYKRLKQLPPANRLILQGGQAQVQSYWDPQTVATVNFSSDEDYREAFIQTYQEAVRSALRANGPTGATLSGGLDSGSLCVLAADQLSERGERLQTYSSIPRYDTNPFTSEKRFGDERPYIEAMAKHNGSIDLHYIDAAGVTLIDGIERSLEIHEQPGHAAGNQYWIIDLLETAREDGIQTLLTGQGGNGTISFAGPRIMPFKKWRDGGTWREFLDELRTWQTTENAPFWRVIKSQILKPLVPRQVLRRYFQARAGRQPWQDYSAINPQFAQDLNLLHLMRKQEHDPTFSQSAGEQIRFFSSGRGVGGALWMENSAAFQMEICDPTMDFRLVQFCLGIPRQQYARDGQSRLLVRRGMAGRMPDEVLWNTDRGRQAADNVMRLLEPHSLAQVQERIDRISRSALAQRYLDVPRMQAIIEHAQKNQDREVFRKVNSILLRGIGVGLFLLRFEGDV